MAYIEILELNFSQMTMFDSSKVLYELGKTPLEFVFHHKKPECVTYAKRSAETSKLIYSTTMSNRRTARWHFSTESSDRRLWSRLFKILSLND
ncbi:hypothetical protein FF1_045164 [Malus domestica]